LLAYKKAHRNVLHAAMQTCCENLNKIEFLRVLQGIRTAALRDTSIALAFRNTGIYPYNPAIVLDMLDDQPASRPSTPQPSIPQTQVTVPHTPKSIQAHRHQGNSLLEAEYEMPIRSQLG
jgi:hypothetical protein